MPDIFDIIGTLTGQPPGQAPPTPLASALAAGNAVVPGPAAYLSAPAVGNAMQGLAQWANVPGPPQSVGDVFDRLGRFLHAANTLGGAAGMIATQPFFARQAQIANAPGLANIPLPWVAGMAGTGLAIPSLLPGGQQIAESLGIAPPTGYGDIIGPAYQASEAQSGGLAGLGAALDKLVETYNATPETVPLTKFIGENVSNPINYLGTIAKAPGIIGQAGTATQEALNLPFRGVKAGITHIPYFSDLSDRAKPVIFSQAFQDLQRNVTAGIGDLGLPVPESLGRGAAGDVRGLGLQAMRGATAQDAELAAEAAAKATANANAAKANIADRMTGGGAPAVVPTAEPAGAAAAAGVPEATVNLAGVGTPSVATAAETAAGAPLHSLKYYNDRAQGTHRFVVEATNAAPGVPAPLPGRDIPLDIVRAALDPENKADDWLAAVLQNVRAEGISPGRAQEQTAQQAGRLGWLRGLGGKPGFTSARTGELIYTPDTVQQVADVVLRLQDLTKRGKPGGLPLGADVRLATGVRWAESQYGATFRAPPPGEKGYYWAAIEDHMAQTGDLPRPTVEPPPPYGGPGIPEAAPEPPVPPAEGLPSPAPPAAGAPDFTLPGYEAPVMNAAQRATDALPANIGAGVAPERAMVPSNPLVTQLQNAVDTRQAGLDALGRAEDRAWAGPTEAAPALGRPPVPEAGPPVVAPGAAPPPAGGAPVAPTLSFAEQQRLRALTEQGMSQQDAVQMLGREQFPPAEATVLADIAASRAAGQEILPAYGELEQTILQGRRNPFDPLRGPEVPPPPPPEGPLPLTPYERFGSEVGQTEAPVASLDELVNAQASRAATARATEEPLANIAAAQRLADARAAREADIAAGVPTRDEVVAGELAPHIASARATLERFAKPEQAADIAAYGERLGTTLDKFFPAVDRARQLRTEAGLGEDASLKNVINTLKKQGSDLTGEAQQLQKDWRSDLLTGDWENIVHQNVLKAEMKARGIDPDKFAGPEWMRNMTAAWRAQALVSGAFHVKNVADSVIKSYFDSGSPGFLAGAKPWNKDDLAALIKAAWHDTSGVANPNAALSPQMRVWGAIHELPVFDTMFAAQNPTLTQALKALPKEDYENVLKQLTPVERELMRVDPSLGVPSAIKESIGPLETGGFLGKIPFVDRVLAMNLRFTMGVEQSARGAKFIDAYNNGIQAGLPQGEAYRQGIAEANRLFFDYQGNLTNADVLMRHVFGFHTFATRNLNYYAPILASNPILIQGLKAWDDFSNQMAEEGGYAANRRFAESMKIPMVGGIGGSIAQFLFGRQGQLFWNPAVYLSIAEQTLSTPQEYRDEPLLGQVLSKARTFGFGLAPWADIPIQMLGAYGARGPQSVTSLDSLLEAGFQRVTGRPGELPWKTIQRIRPPGQPTPASLEYPIRQRLGEMSLEERPDFAQVSPGQPVHPDFVRAMAEGPGNPLYEEAARDVAQERLAGIALGKVVGGGPAFQSQTAGQMAEAMGNMPKDLTKGQRAQYLAGREALLPPEQVPLLSARREIGIKGLNEPGSQPAGEPAESPSAYIARIWPTASPARQWALMQTQDPAMREAITTYLGRRIHLAVPGRGY